MPSFQHSGVGDTMSVLTVTRQMGMDILSCQWKGLGGNREPLKHLEHGDGAVSFVVGKRAQRNEEMETRGLASGWEMGSA